MTRWFALDTLPPGIKYDTTSSGIYALDIVYRGIHPFYIIPSGAPEPLMVYLQALAIYFFGPNNFTLRFLSAIIGVVVVALLYALAKETTRDERIALVATFALAVAVEPINVTRTGLRATLVPLFVTAWLFFFRRGWARGRRRDFAAAGLVLGLGVYTYIATLAIWLVAIALWIHQFLFARPRWGTRFLQFCGMTAIGIFLAAPRLIFQMSYPSAALNRASEVSIFQNPAIQTLGLGGVIAGRLLDYVLMFGITWQGELYNVLHQPLLDPFLFLCFLLGLFYCSMRLRWIEWAWAPLTLAVMLLPDLLGANEPSPNELRTIGVITPTYFLVGVGVVFLLDLAFRRTKWQTLAAAIMMLALLVSAAIGLRAYFGDFVAAAHDGPDADYNRTEIAEAEWILQQSDPVFLPLNEYARSPVHYLTSGHAPQLQSALDANGQVDPRALPHRAWVLFPLDDARPRTEGRSYVDDPAEFVLISTPRIFILPPTDNPVEITLSDHAPDEEIRDSLGNVVAHAYRVDDPDNLFQYESMPIQAPPTQFSQGITLIAATLDDSRVEPGASIGVSLFWHAGRALTADYVIFAHVLDSDGRLVAGADVIPALGAYPTYLWKPGEIVGTHQVVKVPAHVDAGKYTVEVGMYDVLSGNRLDVIDESNTPVDSRMIAGAFKVTPSDSVVLSPSQKQIAEFNHAIAMIGFDAPETIKPGEDAAFTLYWQTLAEPGNDYTVFAHLLDPNGKIVAQADHQPQDGQYPTSIWDIGEQIRDDFSIHIPSDLPAEEYRLEIGWYDVKTARRLILNDGTDHIFLNTRLKLEH
jgi:4-amino-4-deoxy-L-arabinose transferase-like glycosyltransferase